MEQAALLNTAAALLRQDDAVAESFLLAAVYVRAIKTDETPRNIVDALFKALPSSESWPPLRDALLAVLDDEGAAEAQG